MGVLEEGLVDMVDWEAIGAVGEILSAVGVIVTLAYLATQMRQNTRALRSGSLQTYREENSLQSSTTVQIISIPLQRRDTVKNSQMRKEE